MPFKKGQQKTGGRTKQTDIAAKQSSRFIDQLRGYGFDYAKEMAKCLKKLPEALKNKETLQDWTLYYGELKALLPVMVPKLREKEIEVVVNPAAATGQPDASKITTEDLVKALNGTDKQPKPPASNRNSLGTGSVELRLPGRAEEDLPDVDRIEEAQP